MKKSMTFKTRCTVLFAAALTLAGCATTEVSKENVADTIGTGNPYLPLWKHLPDGEPRVFEDPDIPGSSARTSLVRTICAIRNIADQTSACGRLRWKT